MDANQKAIALALATALAIPAEGMRQVAYYDPPGIPTICFGHTRGVKMGDFRTVPECKALLTEDMHYAIAAVDNCVPGLRPNELAAFADAAFNIGPRVACDPSYSTVARLLRQGDVAGACRALTRFSKARVAGVMVELPGLKKRREMERDLCLS
jgi:GH24 family phage-related lysozyme (muramidase)